MNTGLTLMVTGNYYRDLLYRSTLSKKNFIFSQTFITYQTTKSSRRLFRNQIRLDRYTHIYYVWIGGDSPYSYWDKLS